MTWLANYGWVLFSLAVPALIGVLLLWFLNGFGKTAQVSRLRLDGNVRARVDQGRRP